MPRVRQLTEEMRRDAQRREQAQRNLDILMAAVRVSEYKSLTGLANAIGVKYSAFYQSLRNGSIRAVDMARVIQALKLDNETVHALMGCPKKCRFEKGYVA